MHISPTGILPGKYRFHKQTSTTEMKQTLENHLMKVVIDSKGAELRSITDNRSGHEFLYQGNTSYWERRSPILFPIVGSVWNGEYHMDGETYRLGQHGFARDMEFEILTDSPEDEAWFRLDYNEETLKLYPRRFRLEIGYRLDETRLSVMWRVSNLDDREMHFQIGAHPAFNYPGFDPKDAIHGYFLFDRDNLTSELLKEKGCIGDEEMAIVTDSEGMLPLKADTFDINTIIFAERGVHRVSMLDRERRPYLSVLFRAPVVGMWSPAPDAPFVCIEPWWGRCDRVGYSGEFRNREYVNTLSPGKQFDAGYCVIFDTI